MIGTFLIVLLCTIFGTKNGRALLLQAVRNYSQNKPLKLRQKVLRRVSEISTSLYQVLLYILFAPFGNDSKWIRKVKKETWQGNWIMPAVTPLDQVENTAPDADIIILYIHGGGFSTGFSTMHMPAFRLFIKELLQKHQLNGRILSIDYNLSPKSVWPQGHDACVDAYRYLVHDLGVSPCRIIITGDEAGANLAATVALSVKNQRSQERLKDLPPLPLPAGLGLISPLSDITPFHEDVQVSASTQYQRPELLAKYVRGYIQNYYQLQAAEREDMFKTPLVSPFYGDYSNMCPIFVGYGSKELLSRNIVHYINHIEGFSDSQVTVLEGSDCDHNWMVCKLLATNLSTFEGGCKEFADWMANTIKSR